MNNFIFLFLLHIHVYTHLKQPWFKALIEKDVKSENFKELTAIGLTTAGSARLVRVHQVGMSCDERLDYQILHITILCIGVHVDDTKKILYNF